MIGILFMLYGPTWSSRPRARLTVASAPVGFAFAPPRPPPPATEPFVPVAHSLSTDFSIEEPVREVRLRPPATSPPPLPQVTPSRPIERVDATLPDAKAYVPTPKPAPAAPRLGVSAPKGNRHLAPPPRAMPPPLPRTRAARGSDAPAFGTAEQRTVPHAREFEPENTFVD